MFRVAMHASSEAEPVPRLGRRAYRVRIELSAGIRDMPDGRAQPRFDVVARSHQFVDDALVAFPGHQDMASGMRTDSDPGAMNCVQLLPSQRVERFERVFRNRVLRLQGLN